MGKFIEINSEKHKGHLLVNKDGFEIIDCETCGFAHILPVPDQVELEQTYKHDYYSTEKPLYIERYKEDLEWWNLIYTHRYETLEKYLKVNQRNLLDIGSGPGFFLLNGQNRGWKVKGIEPSKQAVKHSRSLGLSIENAFYNLNTATSLGKFDVINMSEVLEHIPDPKKMLTLIHDQLNDDGVICIVVPNDFNPFQVILRDYMDFEQWWIAPPHHINYFNFKSMKRLLNKSGYAIIHQEATFPIDMFLLMGDNYIGDDKLGRLCHKKRMEFEKSLLTSNSAHLLTNMYQKFAEMSIGREIVMFARKNG